MMVGANAKNSSAMDKAVNAVIYQDASESYASTMHGVKRQSLRNRLCDLRKEGVIVVGLHPALMLFKEVHHG